MTDKEFKRLSRAQLIEIIYQLQLQIDTLTDANQELEKQLADRRLRMESAGNIAEAALEVNDVFRSVQSAADQYLNEIKTMREETEAERQKILARAQAEADALIADATRKRCEMVIESVMEEYGQSHTDNG